MDSDLINSVRDLRQILRHLAGKNLLPSAMRNITLRHDPDLDADNERDPRAFCAVHPKDVVIRCAENLECLVRPVRVGVLLHEVAHILANAFQGDEAEVDTDLWILENVPEAGYGYWPGEDYVTVSGKDVVAENIQRVGPDFLRKLSGF